MDELVRLWKVRGPFPRSWGNYTVLSAYRAQPICCPRSSAQQRVGDNADPWPEVNAAHGLCFPNELRCDLKELAPTWTGLPEQRRSLLRLLSRFELSVDQARYLYETRHPQTKAGMEHKRSRVAEESLSHLRNQPA